MDIIEVIASPLVSYVVTAILCAVVGWLTLRIKSYKQQSHTIDQVALMTARQCIYSERFDIDEKVDAYILYKSKGGNHRTKTVMSELVGMDIDEYILNHRAI